MLLICLVVLLPGCWSQKELSGLAIIVGTGVDWTEEGLFRLTVQVAKPEAYSVKTTGSTQNSETNLVVSADGRTILEAEKKLAKKLSREIFWDNCVILVFGNEMAKKGTRMATNYFQRNRGPRENMWLVVTNGKAKEILETYTTLEKTSSQAVSLMIGMENGYSSQLWEFAEMLASKGIQPAMTRVEVKEEGVIPEPELKPTVQKQFDITGVGVFKEDKLVGWLDDSETTGLLWLKGEKVRQAVTVSDPIEADKNVSILIVSGSRKIIPKYDGQNLSFTVKIMAAGSIIEQQSRGNLAEPVMIKVLEERMAQEIKGQVLFALQKVQSEYKIDIFGFGNEFHRKYKKDWREIQDQWDTKFTEAQFNIDVEAQILVTGLQSKRTSVPAK